MFGNIPLSSVGIFFHIFVKNFEIDLKDSLDSRLCSGNFVYRVDFGPLTLRL